MQQLKRSFYRRVLGEHTRSASLDLPHSRAALRSKQCTPAPYRRIRRWEHEAVLDRMQRRLDRQLDAMTIRRRTVEHVFGTLKHWMGSTHFQMRRLGNVSTENELACAGVQPQTRHEDPRICKDTASDEAGRREISHLPMLAGVAQSVQS